MNDYYNSKQYLGRYKGTVKHIKEMTSDQKKCERCKGFGEVEVESNGGLEVRNCGKCDGSGKGLTFVYGFIEPVDKKLEGDIFAHHREIEPAREGFKELAKNDVVEFDVVETGRGLCARNISVIHRPEQQRRTIVRQERETNV